ncbi:MGH1-like glycoside hydrolase domain-containing protein [Paenibacillus borealis]|uniref:Glycoside hydrolase n=1 Tax=Paenibacillus borealis TaxID=160799 RepID=A0A089MMU4_PAEBO|nr:trehalase family glycosidase [Paenibacillus borealis]AIQ57834.1 glycoside hydrolase [Paenibacillus borealis]
MAFLNVYTANKFVSENVFLSEIPENEELPLFKEIKQSLPQPFWNENELAIECYWKAWELAFNNLRKPTSENGFITNYIDTAFNNLLFMWDSCFILLFAKYGNRVFNFQKTLDNLYSKQHKDGFISRVINEMNGQDRFHRFDPVSTGPNILPFSEWEYYLNFGDKDRLKRVFPVLVGYHKWLREFRTWRDGSYWSSGWGCGMDNQPRLEKMYHVGFSHGHMVWSDTCFQQLLSAKLILSMSDEIGRRHEVPEFEEEIKYLSDFVNSTLWDEKSSYYYDLWKNNELNHVKSIGGYWALLADVVPESKKEGFISHLTNEKEFNRPHPIPSLSADHPEYREDAGYWRGGVWAPMNYMVLKGLSKSGYNALAHDIGVRHLEAVVKVYEDTGTLWENYSAEKALPGVPAKPDFVGWTGLSPIAILFEYIFGLKPDVPNSKLEWDVRLLDAHGISQYPFGKEGILDLSCEGRKSTDERPVIRATSNIPVTILVKWEKGKEYIELGK